MNRHALISRSRHRFWLARKTAARQPFIVRTARHQRLAQAFGLPELTEPTAGVPGRVITVPEQGFDQAQQPALLLVDPAFRPLFVEQAEDGYELSPAPDNREELPDQLHNSEEAVEAQSQQGRAESLAQPMENERAKRSPGRIQEQPAGARHTRPTPAFLSRAGVNNQEVPKGGNAQAGEAGRETISADDLFAARGTDRSPQAWLARLMGTSGVVRYDVASPSATTEAGQGDSQPPSMGSEQEVPPKTRSYPVVTGPTTTNQDEQNVVVHFARARFHDPRFWKEPRHVVPPQTNDRWRLIADSRPPIAGSESVARNALQARPASIPLSQRTRRFLQPLVGIDLAGVRVYRDAIAERLTDAYQADAITVGDDVQVATGHPDDTPETLGLLAHEFIHVARQREPHFIPPIARSVRTPLAAQSQAPLADEEALAQQVEGRVKRIVQEQIDQTAPFSVDQAASTYEASVGATSSVPGTTSPPDIWGGLPAPWEPLPGWLVSSPAMEETSIPAVVGSSQPSPAVFKPGGTARVGESYGSADRGTGSIPGEAGVQRAGSERSLNMEETQTATSQPPADMAKTPEPDLDALARQVYSIIKRRLEVESRREA